VGDAPNSLLTATSAQLERIASGTRQAVSQGMDAAGTALSRTYDELAHNEELRKGVPFGFKAAGEVGQFAVGKVRPLARFAHRQGLGCRRTQHLKTALPEGAAHRDPLCGIGRTIPHAAWRRRRALDAPLFTSPGNKRKLTAWEIPSPYHEG